jgi:predicted CXXCH cytochrome family protein
MMDLHFFSKSMVRAVSIGVLILFTSMVAGFLSIPATGAAADEVQETPEEIVINNTVYKTDRKGSVWFSHIEHAEGYADDCAVCHHDYQDGENVWEEGLPVVKCSNCHNPEKTSGSPMRLRTAYHKSCKGCHKMLAAEGGTSAPYKQCTDCHEL